MRWVFLAATCFVILALDRLALDSGISGLPWLSWHLITDMPSRRPERAGFNSALFGTLWVISLTALIAFPVGVGAAIYPGGVRAEKSLDHGSEVNIANLAGVPSVVYGLLGLGIFVELHEPRPSRARRRVDDGAAEPAGDHHRQPGGDPGRSALAAPGRVWRRRDEVAGSAAPCPAGGIAGILTGTILAISRAIGETAPLLVVGASAYIAVQPRQVLRRIHGAADADLRLDAAAAGRVQERLAAAGDHRAAGRAAGYERDRDHPPPAIHARRR